MTEGGGRRRGRRRRKRSPRGAGQGAAEEHAQRALDALAALARSLGERHGVDGRERFPADVLAVPVSVPMGGIGPEAVADLVGTMNARVDETLKARNAFVPGRVYCFLCDDADCVHADPGDARRTFAGYRPTGKPEWISFTNLCIARREPRVDRLFGDDPEIIALVQSASELTEGLLPGFGAGSLAFNVLGQVVAGPVPVTLDPTDTEAERVTLTLQVVETRTGTEGLRVRLNLIGMTLEEVIENAADSEGRGPAESLRRTLRTTRERLKRLGREAALADRRGQESDLASAVGSVLVRLRGDVERVFRPVRRRTRHAQERHVGGERPTSQAVDDALRANYEQLLEDAERGTIIALGPRGRAHVFSPAGRHVTSLKLRPGELDRKLERKRWRALERREADEFKRRLVP